MDTNFLKSVPRLRGLFSEDKSMAGLLTPLQRLVCLETLAKQIILVRFPDVHSCNDMKTLPKISNFQEVNY